MNNDSQKIQNLSKMNDTQAKTIRRQREQIKKLREELARAENMRDENWNAYNMAMRSAAVWKEAHRQLSEVGRAK